jgi:hypothetical protein
VIKSDSDLVEFKPPFGHLTIDQRMQLLNSIGKDAREKYDETRTKLVELISNTDAVELLSRMGWRFFGIQASTGMGVGKEPAGHQHHLEILQGLALCFPQGRSTPGGRAANLVQQAIELLDENTRSFNLGRINGELTTEGVPNPLVGVQEQIRGDTQFVRGEFHPHQLDKYLRRVLLKIEPDFTRVFAVSGIAALTVLQKMVDIIEEKLNRHRRLVGRAVRARKPNKALKEYFSAFPFEKEREQEILATSIAKQVAPDLMRLFLMEEADQFLKDAFSINVEELSAIVESPSDVNAMLHIVDIWSLQFGALKDTEIDHLYLANPVWNRPFIKLSSGQYFWPCPASSMTFGFEMFECLLSSDTALLKAYEDARAQVLEDELEELLRKSFPAGRVLRQLTWTDSAAGTVYENDALVIIDRVALLFEAKSGKVSAAAKRGASDRLVREIKKLMIEPSEQSMRLMNLLSQSRQQHLFATTSGEQVIDSREIDTFVRVNVTFNAIGPLSSRWPELVEASLIKDPSVLAPTMGIADLDTVCGLLKQQSAITHYLRRRAPFEKNASYIADEMDLLAFYLETGFNVGETEYDGTRLMIYGMSDRLNSHFRRNPSGEPRTAPEAKRTKLFSRLISTLEDRRPPHWLEISFRLLEVAVADQETIEGAIKPSIAKVKKSREQNPSWSAQLSNGPPQRKQAMTYVWYRCADSDARKSICRTYAQQTMKMAGTDDCLIVGFDVTQPQQPYGMLGITKRPTI